MTDVLAWQLTKSPRHDSSRIALLAIALVLASVVLVSAVPGAAHADPAPTLLWQRYPGTVEYDGGAAVAVDSAGGIVVGGVTGGSMGKRHEGAYDGFVIKYSSTGAVQWRRQPASPDEDVVFGLATDPADNVIVVGYTWGALAGPNLGQTDGFIVKYAADGTRLWMHQFGTPGSDVAQAVATDTAGNIIVVGSSPLGGFDALVIKYAPDGKETWRRTLGSPGADGASGVATDAAGNIVVVGSAYGEVGGTTATADTDPFVAAYTADGSLRWTQQTGRTRGDDVAFGVAIGDDGRIFVVGARTPDPAKPVQGYLAAFSDDGTRQWQRQVGYLARGVAIGPGGEVLITATAPGGDFAASYTADGAPQWQMKLPTTDTGWAVKPATDTTGHLVVSGSVERGAARGESDGYVARYVLP